MSTEVWEGGMLFDDVDLPYDGKATISYDPETQELILGVRGIDQIGFRTIATNHITPDQAEDYGYALLRAAAKVRTALEASA